MAELQQWLLRSEMPEFSQLLVLPFPEWIRKVEEEAQLSAWPVIGWAKGHAEFPVFNTRHPELNAPWARQETLEGLRRGLDEDCFRRMLRFIFVSVPCHEARETARGLWHQSHRGGGSGQSSQLSEPCGWGTEWKSDWRPPRVSGTPSSVTPCARGYGVDWEGAAMPGPRHKQVVQSLLPTRCKIGLWKVRPIDINASGPETSEDDSRVEFLLSYFWCSLDRSVIAVAMASRGEKRPLRAPATPQAGKLPWLRKRLPPAVTGLRLYETLHREYARALQEEGLTVAMSRVADTASEKYAELHRTALELLRSVASRHRESGSRSLANYDVLIFRGEACGNRRRNLSVRLASLRRRRGKVREALCSVLAALCCRLQKNWLAAYDEEEPVRGYFAHSLVEASSVFRVALRPGRPLRLASLLIYQELPLAQALAAMDHGGPFPEGHEKEPIGERRYGLQRVGVEGCPGEEQKERLCDVEPEARIRELMKSKAPVIVLDVYCALAPKDHAKRHNLGPVVKAEFAALLRRSRDAGQAVLFLVGGERPAQLAQKVYLQPRFTSIGGLMCGYLRWKPDASAPWEPPKLQGQRRIIFGLQLP
ncbi:unnamed protein product [Symbiodinium necroappetens]|uniref:Uncharacterized protein n=1 Tax=Symbiodinium necroappetens TaxID=1628268 RepID=A0A812Z585_9DINO|nr:unnamed protein product [Symbiodinium necroappetens]